MSTVGIVGEGAEALTALNSSLASLVDNDREQRREGRRATFYIEKQDRRSSNCVSHVRSTQSTGLTNKIFAFSSTDID